MKSLWKKFIGWFKPKTNNHHRTNLRSGMNKHYRLDTLCTLDEGEEVVSLKQYKMQKLIDQKKNRKPFYKDGNKKDWE